MRRITNHVKRWNKWRKHNLNGPLHKFLVLIGLIKSPTMALVFTDEEVKQILETKRKLEK